MPKFTISVEINKPPEIIKQALEIPENMVQWTSDLEKFEVIEGRSGEAGAVAHAHYVQKGRPYVMEDVMEYCAPGKKYVSRVTGEGMTARVETILRPTEEGTEMVLSWSGTSDAFPAKWIFPLMGPVIKRRAKADLETFKWLVESYGTRFPRQVNPENMKSGD